MTSSASTRQLSTKKTMFVDMAHDRHASPDAIRVPAWKNEVTLEIGQSDKHAIDHRLATGQRELGT